MKRSKHRIHLSLLTKLMRASLYKPASLAAVALASSAIVAPAYAQEIGSIKGTVTTDSGQTAVAGVEVIATSPVMPKARTATTRADGTYTLPLLKPGNYELSFVDAAGVSHKMTTTVLLDQTTVANMALDVEAERILITGTANLYTIGNSSLSNSLGQEVVSSVPIGEDYRDLLKLVPGVEYTENGVLGPSAGGSGVDNKYGFDGVDVSLPMFGNLASEPSTHDIANVSMDRGGANAIGFNRSGGFAINTTSKSGTNEFEGMVEYKTQPKDFVSDIQGTTPYELDQQWLTGSAGGPLIEDTLFFYGSYQRRELSRDNKETAYGPVKDYSSVKDEYFGKFTYAPTADILLNASYRYSDRDGEGQSIGSYETDSVSYGSDATQRTVTFDGSWLLSDVTQLTFSFGRFELESLSNPDVMLSEVPMVGGQLDLNNLDMMGYLNVPQLNSSEPADSVYNVGAQALIDRYGYVSSDGDLAGGGGVGAYSTINDQSFYRDSFEFAIDHELYTSTMSHQLHFGFKWAEGKEVLSRLSNGWGSISWFGGAEVIDGTDTPYYYRSITQQMSLVSEDGTAVSPIISYNEAFNVEINDIITHGNFTYNVGVLISKDIYYGQGLRENSNNYSGFELAPGEKYKMYTIDWKDMVQPRLGATYEYESGDTVFANYASYNPEASSLARAASWDRNTRALLNVYFDEQGNYISSEARNGSSGKMFDENMKPRRIDEWTLGATKIINDEFTMRTHVRHKRGSHFWEDTWNGSRLYGEYGQGAVPENIAERGYYIEDLDMMRYGADGVSGTGDGEIGGSSYVIAEMDGGFTKYWELNLEGEYRGDNTFLSVSYVWSHYYGNFDQDNTTATTDANTFIGSSNYGDGRGRLIWDNKHGKLRGDRPHKLKIYGYYETEWDGKFGAYLNYQSGQVWERWSAEYYGYSFASSATNRYAEPAGTRRSASHWHVDLNYEQAFNLAEGVDLTFRADLYNLFDRQTGYNINPYENDVENFGTARSWYSPRRLRLSVAVDF